MLIKRQIKVNNCSCHRAERGNWRHIHIQWAVYTSGTQHHSKGLWRWIYTWGFCVISKANCCLIHFNYTLISDCTYNFSTFFVPRAASRRRQRSKHTTPAVEHKAHLISHLELKIRRAAAVICTLELIFLAQIAATDAVKKLPPL